MKLYVKQKFLSLNASFNIWDENNQEKYNVEGKLISLGRQFTIYKKGEKIAFIAQEILNFFPKFNIYIEDEKIASIQKKFSLFNPIYEIENLNWVINGDIFAHEYTISKENKIIASISKKYLKLTDTYEIDINNEEDEIMVLAVVITIDAVMSIQRRANN